MELESRTKTKVLLSVRCEDIEIGDIISRSDPMVVLYKRISNSSKKSWSEVGRTEVFRNYNTNPEFEKKFKLDFVFEVYQLLKFAVVNVKDDAQLGDHGYLG